MNRKIIFYLSVFLGAASMVVLRFCDKAGVLSAALVLFGVTALVFSERHAKSKSENFSLAAIMALVFAVRYYGYTGVPGQDILLGLAVGLIMFLLLSAERLLKKFEDRFWYTLIYPAFYLLFLYFTEVVKINMPFRLEDYLSSLLVLSQITAAFGIYSLDFLLAWTASVIVFLTDHKVRKQCVILAIVYAFVLCGVLCFGVVHLNRMNAQEAAKSDRVRVGCTTGPYYGPFYDASYNDMTLEDNLASLDGLVKDAAEKNVEILVFSEEAYGVYDKDEDTFLEEAEKLAAENDMHLLLAYSVEDSDGSENGKDVNKLCWISSEGTILYDYIKYNIIPFIETSECVTGTEYIKPFEISVHGKTLKVATAICYDGDFDLFMSHMGKNLDLLLLPTWDWKVIAEIHFSVARLRAIASETTLVRSDYDGWNAVIDSAGNVLMRDNTNDSGYENVWICDVPIR